MRWPQGAIFLGFCLMFTGFCLFVPYFFTWGNLVGLALSMSMVGIVSCGMLFVMASGDFDLSVEGILVLSGVLCAVVIQATQSVLLGVLTGVAAGTLVGAVNGVIIARFKINSLIVSLATLYVVRGLSFIVSNGSSVGISDESFFQLGNGTFLGIPNPVWIMAAMFGLFGILLNRTTFGRETLAIGGNKEAARTAGIPVDRVKIVIFTIQGLVAGVAGIVLASRMTSGQPTSSTGFALDVIAACMLGGVSQTNGTGTMRGVIVGVLVMGTIQNAMNLIGIPTFYQYLTKGTVLLLAVIYDKFNRTAPGKSRGFRLSDWVPQGRTPAVWPAGTRGFRKPSRPKSRRPFLM